MDCDIDKLMIIEIIYYYCVIICVGRGSYDHYCNYAKTCREFTKGSDSETTGISWTSDMCCDNYRFLFNSNSVPRFICKEIKYNYHYAYFLEGGE